MDYILPISEVRGRLPELLKKISKDQKHLVITRNGKAEGVMLSPAELETLEIRADRDLLKTLIRSEQDMKAGRLYSHKEVFGKHV